MPRHGKDHSKGVFSLVSLATSEWTRSALSANRKLGSSHLHVVIEGTSDVDTSDVVTSDEGTSDEGTRNSCSDCVSRVRWNVVPLDVSCNRRRDGARSEWRKQLASSNCAVVLASRFTAYPFIRGRIWHL